MEVHPESWSAEMDREHQDYDDKKLAHTQARANYEDMVLYIKEQVIFKPRCWPCIAQDLHCNSDLPCDQCVLDENEHVCEYPPERVIIDFEKAPLPFYILAKEDHQDLLDLANDWLEAANKHLAARISFQMKWAGAWIVKNGPEDLRTDQEGHLTKLNGLKQEICAVSSRVIEHLAWRDKELYAERSGSVENSSWTDIKVKFNQSKDVSILEYEGQHRFPSMTISILRRKENVSDPKSTKHLESNPWN